MTPEMGCTTRGITTPLQASRHTGRKCPRTPSARSHRPFDPHLRRTKLPSNCTCTGRADCSHRMECGAAARPKGTICTCSGTSTRHSSTEEAARICSRQQQPVAPPYHVEGMSFQEERAPYPLGCRRLCERQAPPAASQLPMPPAHMRQDRNGQSAPAPTGNLGYPPYPGQPGPSNYQDYRPASPMHVDYPQPPSGAVLPDNSSAARVRHTGSRHTLELPQGPGEYYQPVGQPATSQQP